MASMDLDIFAADAEAAASPVPASPPVARVLKSRRLLMDGTAETRSSSDRGVRAAVDLPGAGSNHQR